MEIKSRNVRKLTTGAHAERLSKLMKQTRRAYASMKDCNSYCNGYNRRNNRVKCLLLIHEHKGYSVNNKKST